MGIFGSSKKTTVGTNVMRVMEDKLLPNSIITGGIMATQNSDGQLIEHAVEELSNGIGIRADRLYRDAQNNYVNGMPSGTTMTNLMGRETVIKAIEAEVGKTIGLTYYEVGPLNLFHVGWSLLVKDYGYNSVDNSLTYGGRKVYLTDMQLYVVEATASELVSGALDMWGMSPTAGKTPLRPGTEVLDYDKNRPAYTVDSSAAADYLIVKYCYEVDSTKVVEGVTVPTKSVVEGQFNLTFAGWDMEASYHQARYTIDAKAGYWSYRIGSNTNPVVEAIFDEGEAVNGTFFPMVYFRFNKAVIAKDSEEHKSSTRMLKHLNMKFDDIADGINENPDIADVEQAFLTFAVKPDTENQIERRYLFDFFDNLWEGDVLGDLGTVVDGIKNWQLNVVSGIVIKDKKFRMSLAWDSITKTRVVGNVAKQGQYHSSLIEREIQLVTKNMAGKETTVTTKKMVRTFCRQITENVYEEVAVVGLRMSYHIWAEYKTTGDENNKDILLIPLDYAITKNYTIRDREELYARSMHYVFNSRVVTKLKWYETGIFRVIMIVVAIIITIYTLGAAWQTIAAAWAVGGVVAVIYAIIPMILQYVLVSLVVRKVVAMIGIQAAFIVAIIAAVAGAYGAMAEGGVANAPWAADLMSLSSNITSSMQKELRTEFNDLASEYRTFKEYAKDKQDHLKEVNAALDGKTHLVPMIIWGETPNDFYQRTVHSGNIGTVGIDAVASYVDAALTLPKLTDSLGDF